MPAALRRTSWKHDVEVCSCSRPRGDAPTYKMVVNLHYGQSIIVGWLRRRRDWIGSDKEAKTEIVGNGGKEGGGLGSSWTIAEGIV